MGVWRKRSGQLVAVLHEAVNSVSGWVTTLLWLGALVVPHLVPPFEEWTKRHVGFYPLVTALWLVILIAKRGYAAFVGLESKLAVHERSPESKGIAKLRGHVVKIGDYSERLDRIFWQWSYAFLEGRCASAMIGDLVDNRLGDPRSRLVSEEEAKASEPIEHIFLDLEILGLMERLPGNKPFRTVDGDYGHLEFRLTESGKRMLSQLEEELRRERSNGG
jgi:hypothetical protein